METEVSLSHLPEIANCPYPEPDRSSPCPHPTSLRFVLILSSHLHLSCPSNFLPSGFPTKTLYAPLLSPMLATCPAHLSLLDLITRIVFGEEYRAYSFLLCNLLHSPVTSSLSGPSIFLSTLFSKTLSLHSSFSVSNQVSHLYKQPANVCGIQHLMFK